MTSLGGVCGLEEWGKAQEGLGTRGRHHSSENAFWGPALLFGGPWALVEGEGWLTKASREIRLPRAGT